MVRKRIIKLDTAKDVDSFVLKNIKKVIEKYKQQELKVGVFGGSYPSGESIPEVAMMHEFGSETPRTFVYKGKKITIKGIPTRSFLRMPVRKLFGKDNSISEVIKLKLYEEFTNGYTGKTFKTLGLACENQIKEAFATQGFGKWESNISEQYKELKGSSSPLIDTGMLYGSITSKIVKKGQ